VGEWLGVGLLLRYKIHPFFLIFRVTRRFVQGLSDIVRIAREINVPGSLEYVSIGSESPGGGEPDDGLSTFVIPASEWKLIGKEAAAKIKEGEVVVIRVSEDHAKFMQVSSLPMTGPIIFELDNDDDKFTLYINLAHDTSGGELLVVPNDIPVEWVDAWTSNGVGGSHGQLVCDAISNPGAPAITQDEAREANPPSPPQQPAPPAAEEEADDEDDEEEEEEEAECEGCGRIVSESEIHEDGSCCVHCRASCEICHGDFSREDLADNGRVCADCAALCDHCDRFFHPSNVTNSLCVECRRQHRECVECHGYHHEEDMIGDVCENCAEYCEICDEGYPPNQVTDGICISCRRQHFSICNVCGESVSNDDILPDGACYDCGVECQWCGELYHPRNINSDGFCETCMTLLQRCDECGKFKERSALTQGACEDCLVSCKHCGERCAPVYLGAEGICGDCMLTSSPCAQCGSRVDVANLNADMVCENCETAASRNRR
jgi:ribosomal protein L12E/L44/L45/RPP1/RPP2